MRTEKLKLHEAMEQAIKNLNSLSGPALTWFLNASKLYQKRDKSVITPNQIYARISKYPHLFYIDSNKKVCLRMHEKLVNRIRKCLRKASQEGLNGFAYDNDKSPEEQDEDWMYFEDMCISEIEDLDSQIQWDALEKGE